MVFALAYQDRVRLAVVHEKLFFTAWEPLANALLPLMGFDMDKVWENLVMAIGHFEVMEGVTIEEQITIDGEKQKVIKQIETLEKKLKAEKQPMKRYGLYKQIQELKENLEP